MTAPRLTVDHARSFEVPCLFDGRPATLLALRLRHFGDGWLVALAGRVLFLTETPDALLGHGWHSPGIAPPAQFDSAQEALVAAFATDQIEPRGDDR